MNEIVGTLNRRGKTGGEGHQRGGGTRTSIGF